MMVKHGHEGDTEFRFHKPGAHQVFLVGDFSEAQECKVPMNRNAEGDWVCRLRLAQGVYRFRYLADGEWHIERDSGLGWAPFDCNSLTVIDDEEPAYFAG